MKTPPNPATGHASRLSAGPGALSLVAGGVAHNWYILTAAACVNTNPPRPCGFWKIGPFRGGGLKQPQQHISRARW